MTISICNTCIDQTGRELIAHGTVAFPIACYYDDLIQDPVPWHWHEELEAVLISDGQAVIATDCEKYILRKGEGFFINTGVLHAAWAIDLSGCHFHSLVFHPRLIGGSLESIFWKHYLQPLLNNSALSMLILKPDIAWNQQVLDTIEAAWQSCKAEELGYEFTVRHALSELIFLLYQHCQFSIQKCPSDKELRESERIKKMLQYIHSHFSEDINTSSIANSIMVSPSECLRCFHHTIGTTPIQYLREYRIQKAAEQLRTTHKKIADIGAECGFQEMSYFAKTFREIHGCTPSEYRS